MRDALLTTKYHEEKCAGSIDIVTPHDEANAYAAAAGDALSPAGNKVHKHAADAFPTKQAPEGKDGEKLARGKLAE